MAFVCLALFGLVKLGNLFLGNWKRGQPRTMVANMGSPPVETHPHFVRERHGVIIASHLYEGLFRLGKSDQVLPGLAEDFEVSEDRLHYRFHLRTSYWSNGEPLTAHDFVKSWKAVIEAEHYPSSQAFYFNLIKGVEAFRSEKASWSDVGLRAEGDHILCVSLKHPVSYFLQLLCIPIFYPVYCLEEKQEDVTNGPFLVASQKWNDHISLKKNPFFWDHGHVQMEIIRFIFVDNADSQVGMLERGDVHFIGGGLFSLSKESEENMHQTGLLSERYPLASCYALVFNTKRGPFRSQKIRKAFSIGINREQLAKGVFKRALAAYSYIPSVFPGFESRMLIEESKTEAQRLLREGLKELDLSFSDLGQVTLSCWPVTSYVSEAFQQQWLEHLGIHIKIEVLEASTLYRRLTEGDFDVSSYSRDTDYFDPYALFYPFHSSDQDVNFSGWSPPEVRVMLQKSFFLDKKEREEHLFSLDKDSPF
ncbi:peptide ABC transporter substrate-binding protein [Candidatus Similichlamydia laticola]|nr:peptide ABC transporter substrate-binding protein [Candidatus Similichlamydia laticola]